uniref:NADH-ubiquinone oxidoreductase chain 1 n=1 Tax=Passalidae sp. GENSP01 TaxID=1205571 RepID=A0A0S2MRS8_9SCAR|nr:NADH deshydrogenase subunit 1 [Passalidae sp. GENSP01]
MLMSGIILGMIEGLILVVGVLVGVAFLTLMERKVLGYIQIRLGPNKVGFVGIIQPFGDAIKLFTKEQVYPFLSNIYLFIYSPIFNLMFSLLLWILIPYLSGLFSFNLGVLFFLCFSSLSVYVIMFSGWSSNSNYSLLGSLRAITQFISYEVSLFLILLSFLLIIVSLSLFGLMKFQSFFWFIFLCLPLSVMWMVTSLAETNRTPFDFAEGESELVSGFNVEYSSGGFILLFLAEYTSILFMSMMCVILFMGGNFSDWSFYLKVLFMAFFWVWVRGTLPRFRFDKLMMLCWKSFLPVSLNFLGFYYGLKVLVMNFY